MRSRATVGSRPDSTGAASNTSRSELSICMGRYRPPTSAASSCRSSSASEGITMVPLRSLRKPPSGSGMGAPVLVPTPMISSSAPRPARAFLMSLLSRLLMPSVISRILPWLMPPECSSSTAWSTAAAGSLPGTGIMSGFRAGSRLAIVGVSSVSGVTICASPA